MANGEKMTAQKAFSEFAKRFARSSQSTDDSKVRIVHENTLIQQKINALEEDFVAEAISSYNKYVNPFRTFGKTSRTAEAIDNDEKDLLCAYNLFKAVNDANNSIGNNQTFIKIDSVHSPLVNREIYTLGGEFIYLQCWLRYCKQITDFVPILKSTEKNLETIWTLHFVSPKKVSWSFQEQEIIAVLESNFHPQ